METIRQKISLKEYCQTAAGNATITPFEFGDSVINWNVLYKYFMGVELKGDFLTLVQRAELVKFGQLLCGESWYHDVIAINPDETGDDLLCDDAREWISKAITWLTETSDTHLALIEIYASKLADLKALLDVKRTQSRTGENVTASHRTGENVTADKRGGEINEHRATPMKTSMRPTPNTSPPKAKPIFQALATTRIRKRKRRPIPPQRPKPRTKQTPRPKPRTKRLPRAIKEIRS